MPVQSLISQYLQPAVSGHYLISMKEVVSEIRSCPSPSLCGLWQQWREVMIAFSPVTIISLLFLLLLRRKSCPVFHPLLSVLSLCCKTSQEALEAWHFQSATLGALWHSLASLNLFSPLKQVECFKGLKCVSDRARSWIYLTQNKSNYYCCVFSRYGSWGFLALVQQRDWVFILRWFSLVPFLKLAEQWMFLYCYQYMVMWLYPPNCFRIYF